MAARGNLELNRKHEILTGKRRFDNLAEEVERTLKAIAHHAIALKIIAIHNLCSMKA